MQNPDQAKERFSKRLTQNEIEKCLVLFPITAVEGIFTFEEGRMFCLDVVGRTGEAWTFMATFQTNEDMGSVVSISWPQFVREKALKANDEVTFVRLAPDESDNIHWKKFKIEVRREIRLFGQDIWGDLMV
ncbi:hypothetical protein QQP08_006844 [Theobroma cacao]|nr:hypothetical protein QQP08_006844 [Theobroma cacao]